LIPGITLEPIILIKEDSIMHKSVAPLRQSTLHLISIPFAISVLITMLRLIGEVNHWSEKWFSSETGGVIPSGVTWLIGITWLALPFGVYFAWRLAHAGEGPAHPGRTVGLAVVGLVLMRSSFPILPRIKVGFPHFLIFIWLFMAVAAAIQYFGWPSLFKTLLAYGIASRLVVVVVMFLAIRGHWGTHYDYVGMPPQFQMPLWSGFFWLAFFPQLIFWVGFSILAGTLSGSITAAILRGRKTAIEPA
jgi:hypothetical protein